MPSTLVLIGAGNRGADVYGRYAFRHPEEFQFVAVAEPVAERRESFAAMHGIPPERTFSSWEDLLRGERLADAAVIATPDRLHYDPAMAAMALGYDVLLEKPLAVDPAQCLALEEEAIKRQRLLLACHVLRYSPFFTTIGQLIAEGRIGRIISIQHNENVGYWHMAHSYVRGNWRNTSESSPMILAKSCHDLDILLWLAGGECTRVASFGSLAHFRAEDAPLGAVKRCLDGCSAEPACPFSARRIYLGANTDWPVSVISQDTSLDARAEALRTGPYGRCVYACDNDVVDHQTVALEFANGVTAAFTMCGLTHEISRTIKIMGTAGEIGGHLERNEIALHAFADGRLTVMRPTGPTDAVHGGGDEGLMRAFASALRAGRLDDRPASVQMAAHSHLLAFAAEEARLKGKVVEMKEYTERIDKGAFRI